MGLFKKGELTSSQIISLVLAIAGFVIVLIFIAILYGSGMGEDQREVCRLSILTRATTPHVAQAAVPIACTTEKICVSATGSKKACPEFLGEKNVRGVELDGKSDADNARIIERVSAEAMYQCWSMTGKGQLDLFGKAAELLLGSTGEPTCIICSRIAYAENVNGSILGLVDLESYLERERIPLPNAKETYLQAFTDRGTKSFAAISKKLNDKNAEEPLKINASDKTISGASNGRQIAFLFTQTKIVSPAQVLKNLGYAAVGSTFAIAKTPIIGQAAGALVFNPVGLATTVVVGGAAAGGAAWNAYSGQRAAAGYCGSLTTAVDKDSLREGCSLIQAVNYNVPDINALCTSSIQGNP